VELEEAGRAEEADFDACVIRVGDDDVTLDPLVARMLDGDEVRAAGNRETLDGGMAGGGTVDADDGVGWLGGDGGAAARRG
jgi:hypothetical protein